MHIFNRQKLDASQDLRRKKIKDLLTYIEENCRAGKAIDFGQAAFNTSINLLSNTIFSMIWFIPMSESLRIHFPLLKKLDLQVTRHRNTLYAGEMFEVLVRLIDQ